MNSLVARAIMVVGAALTAPILSSGQTQQCDLARLTVPGDAMPETDSARTRLGGIINQAAAEFDVPSEWLLVLGLMGSAFEDRGAAPTIERGYGIMALRENAMGGDSLLAAAMLTGVHRDDLVRDPRLNIRGAAAVLDAYARIEGLDRDAGLEAWMPVVERYAGLDDVSSRLFAWQARERLVRGFRLTNSTGETFELSPRVLSPTPETVNPGAAGVQTVDYVSAIWDAAAACNYANTTTTKDAVVIHMAEGTAAGVRAWYQNCASGASAHYVVSELGTIWQMVSEAQVARHASCYDERSVGIQHEGYSASPAHPQVLYDASAALTRDVCDRWSIPQEKRTSAPGIVGHQNLVAWGCGPASDPGAGWDWDYYIAQVRGILPPPDWDAWHQAESFPVSMTAGSAVLAWVEFTNQGTQSWYRSEVHLATSGPPGRVSPFCLTSEWADCTQPTGADTWQVRPGQVGRFTFTLQAPAQPGTYVERYRLWREGSFHFGPEVVWTIDVTPAQSPAPTLVAAVSRFTHGSAGVFDLDAFGATSVECRRSSASQILVTFDAALQGAGGLDEAGVQLSSGTVTHLDVNGQELIVGVAGVADGTALQVTFPGIYGVDGQPVVGSLCFRWLCGDATNDGNVDILDLVQARNALNGAVGPGTFRMDVNADGAVNVLDLVAIRNHLNRSAPSCP